MNRMCREPMTARLAQPKLRVLLPHLKIITDPAMLARLSAEARKRGAGKTSNLKLVPQADLDYC